MYFTTAKAFCYLLRTNGISVSSMGEQGMSMFCGDIGFRPLDIMTAQQLNCRNSDPNRFYWEELPCEGSAGVEGNFYRMAGLYYDASFPESIQR